MTLARRGPTTCARKSGWHNYLNNNGLALDSRHGGSKGLTFHSDVERGRSYFGRTSGGSAYGGTCGSRSGRGAYTCGLSTTRRTSTRKGTSGSSAIGGATGAGTFTRSGGRSYLGRRFSRRSRRSYGGCGPGRAAMRFFRTQSTRRTRTLGT